MYKFSNGSRCASLSIAFANGKESKAAFRSNWIALIRSIKIHEELNKDDHIWRHSRKNNRRS